LGDPRAHVEPPFELVGAVSLNDVLAAIRGLDSERSQVGAINAYGAGCLRRDVRSKEPRESEKDTHKTGCLYRVFHGIHQVG